MANVNEFIAQNGEKYLFAKKTQLTIRKNSDYVGKRCVSLAVTEEKLAEIQKELPDEISRLVDRWNIINVLLDAVKSGLGDLPIPEKTMPEVAKADKTASDFGVLLKDYADFKAIVYEQNKDNEKAKKEPEAFEKYVKSTFVAERKDVYSEKDLNIFSSGEKPKEKEKEKSFTF